MAVPVTWKGVVAEYDKCAEDTRDYLEHFPSLTKSYPWDVVITYLFGRVELAQNMTIYCGCVKCHRVDTELAKIAVNNQHMTREGFKSLFKSIFGKPIPKEISTKLDLAEDIRDKILHGKSVTEADKRKAALDLIHYAEMFNNKMQEIAGFRPFGSLQGFKGRGQSLDKSTSRWVLKGIGFSEFQ
jgi:hypothetical protein